MANACSRFCFELGKGRMRETADRKLSAASDQQGHPALGLNLSRAGLLACGSPLSPRLPDAEASVTRSGNSSPLTVAGAAPALPTWGRSGFPLSFRPFGAERTCDVAIILICREQVNKDIKISLYDIYFQAKTITCKCARSALIMAVLKLQVSLPDKSDGNYLRSQRTTHLVEIA